jgi:glycosyltransferase involved in cell wall biosynthesis
MPSYNEAEFIEDAIRSTLLQNVQLELIIVDDYSTDDSRRIIASWARRDRRIKPLYHERNLGIASTMNDGIKLARGKYLAIISGDDMFKEDALNKIVGVLESSKDSGAAIADAECIDSMNRTIGLLFSDIYRKPSIHEGNFIKELAPANLVFSGVVRKSVLKRHHICWDKRLKYLNDWMFWLDLARVSNFVFIDEPLYYYRIHPKSTSHKSKLDRGSLINDFEIYDVILSKYGHELDLPTRRGLLRTKGWACAKLGDFMSARRYWRQSLDSDCSVPETGVMLVAILLSYVSKLFWPCLEILQHGARRRDQQIRQILERYRADPDELGRRDV